MNVFNYSELHFSEVTSYKIHTLERVIRYKSGDKKTEEGTREIHCVNVGGAKIKRNTFYTIITGCPRAKWFL